MFGPQGQLNWVLSPFAYTPSAARLSSFKKELLTQFGPNSNSADYANAARNRTGREKLRKCYDAVWKTHNLHSMALYAGPDIWPGTKLRCTAHHGHFLRRIVQPGWLSTGDFDLSAKRRRTSLLKYYERYSAMIGQMMLPHHGSDHSFDATVLSAFSDLTFAIAAVGSNGHGHPGRHVQNAVNAALGPGFVRVDENPSSRYGITGRV